MSGFRNLRILTGLFPVVALAFLALFATINPATRGEPTPAAGVTRRAFMRVTPQGAIQSTDMSNSKGPSASASIAPRRVLGPVGNTLWHYDDQTAIADGVSIDANNVWGAWILSGARLTIHAITGNGTPAWSFSSFGSDNSGVAAAKGADRSGFMESNAGATTFGNMALGPAATAHRTGHSFIQSVIRICLLVPGRLPLRATDRLLRLLLAIL
jgi:hypothetical protein